MRSHRKTVALNRASFLRVLFHMRSFWKRFTNHINFFQSHEFFFASASATIVKVALNARMGFRLRGGGENRSKREKISNIHKKENTNGKVYTSNPEGALLSNIFANKVYGKIFWRDWMLERAWFRLY